MPIKSRASEIKENIQRLETTLDKNCWNKAYANIVRAQIQHYRNELDEISA